MFSALLKRINAQKTLDLQNLQYSENLLMTDSVPPSTTRLGSVNVSNLGHFYCMFLTGSFETLAAGPTDDGIDHLRGKLIDGSDQRQLFNDYVPLSLLLTPGRRKSAHDLTGANSNNLFYPTKFEYLFTANSDILLDVKNDSDFEIDYDIVFWGIRIKSSIAVAGVRPQRG